MPQSKKVILPTSFAFNKTADKFRWSINAPNLVNADVRFFLGNESKRDKNAAFYRKVEEGSLLLQEYNYGEKARFYFDVNEEGELVVVHPEGFDVSINSAGELCVTDIGGIGSMEIELDFFVY